MTPYMSQLSDAGLLTVVHAGEAARFTQPFEEAFLRLVEEWAVGRSEAADGRSYMPRRPATG